MDSEISRVITLTFILSIAFCALIQITYAEMPPAVYEAQLRVVYSANSTNIGCTVNTVQQNDSYGYGPSYLLNGFSNKGYWYQIGIAWNPRYKTTGHSNGFFIVYEVFAPNNKSIYPKNGSGVINASRIFKPNNTILLKLYFLNSNVIMYAKDLNTSKEVNLSYSAENATHFVGFNTSSHSLYFTGVMTEWHYNTLNSNEVKPVVYHILNIDHTVWFMAGDEESNITPVIKQIPWDYGKAINIGHFSVYFDNGTFITAGFIHTNPPYTSYASIIVIAVLLLLFIRRLRKSRK